jgi:tetratricopeptide (TPR) repeat protein
MEKNRKSLLIISVGAVALTIIFSVTWFVFTNRTNPEIPEISNLHALSGPVREQISEAYSKARRNPSAANLGYLGMVYHSSANYTEASKCYKLAVQKDKSGWKWNYYDGYLNMEMGNTNQAILNFTDVTEKKPEIDLAWYYLGEEYKNLKNNELAEKSLAMISSNNQRRTKENSTRQDHFPISVYANFELARIYFDSGRTDLAEKTLEEIIKSNTLFGPSYKLLGSICNLKGDTSLGKQLTIRANDLVDFSPPVDTLMDKLVLMSRSELYLLKKIDEAEASFHADWALKLVDQGLQYMPENSYLISKAIKIFLWKNMNQQAIALTDKHLNLLEGNYSEIKNTGLFFFQKGLFTQAAKYWTKALEIQPDETTIQEYLAKCLWATGNKNKAIEILEEIIGKNPVNPDVIADVADLYFQFNEKEKMDACLVKLNQIAPSNPILLRISGEVAESKKEIKKAISLYKSSFKANPNDVKTIKSLGGLLLMNKMWAEYINFYKQALTYHPNNPDFLSRMGEVLVSCPEISFRDYEQGKTYSERAFTFYNCPPDVLIASGSHLAYAYAMLGEKQKAVTTISQTINIGRREKIADLHQKKLEALLVAFQDMDEQ